MSIERKINNRIRFIREKEMAFETAIVLISIKYLININENNQERSKFCAIPSRIQKLVKGLRRV